MQPLNLFIWLALAVVAGVIASNKGRSGSGFFLLAVFLTPLVGIIAALIAQPDTQRLEMAALDSGEQKRCAFCAELIRADAVLCRYCGKPDLPADSAMATGPRGKAAQVPLRDRWSYKFGYKLGKLFGGRR